MTSCDTSCGSEPLFEPNLTFQWLEQQCEASWQLKGQWGSRITNVNLTVRISDLSVVAVTMLQTCGSESSRQSHAVCSAGYGELRPALIWKCQELLRWDPGCIIHHTGTWPLGSVLRPPYGFHLYQSAGQAQPLIFFALGWVLWIGLLLKLYTPFLLPSLPHTHTHMLSFPPREALPRNAAGKKRGWLTPDLFERCF